MLTLPKGCTVISRFYFPLSLEDQKLNDRWKDLSPPPWMIAEERASANHDLGQKYLFIHNIPVLPLTYPFIESFECETKCEAYSIAGFAATVEVSYKWLIEKETSLSAMKLSNHWWGTGKNLYINNTSSIFSEAGLTGKYSPWWFPVTFIIPPPEQQIASADQDAFLLSLSTVNKIAASSYESEGITGQGSFDSACFFITSNSKEVLPTIDFFLRAVIADYHLLENTAAKARALLSQPDSSLNINERMMTCRKMIKVFNRNIALLDPAELAYQESDITFVENLRNSWRRDELYGRVNHLIEKAYQLYQFDLDQSQKKDADKLNIGIAILSVIGIAGTVAGVLSTIDYNNTHFDMSGRILWIGIFTGITLTAFAVMLLNGKRSN